MRLASGFPCALLILRVAKRPHHSGKSCRGNAGVRLLLFERKLLLILRSIAKRCVSKDEAVESAALWFETDCCAILLTMRV